MLKVYTGSDGTRTLYDDDGSSQKYLEEEPNVINILWDDKSKILKMNCISASRYRSETGSRIFRVQLLPGNESKILEFTGKPVKVRF